MTLGQYEALIAAAPSIISAAGELFGGGGAPCSPPVQVPPGYVPEPPAPRNNYAPPPNHFVNPCTGHGVRIGSRGCSLHDTGTWTPEELAAAGLSCVAGLSLGAGTLSWLWIGGAALLGVILLVLIVGGGRRG